MSAINIRNGRPPYDPGRINLQFMTNKFTSSEPQYNFANPDKLRGAWFVLLSNACHSNAAITDKVFCKQLRILSSYWPIASDKHFFTTYLRDHPPEELIGETLGMFAWLVGYMNAYRKHRGKELYVKYTLYRLVNEPDFGTCHQCGN
jgi:hypothetical protein